MPVVPICAETIGDILCDLPIRPAAGKRLEDLIQPLDAPLGARERAFLFQAWAGRQDHIGETAGHAEENVLHHEEIELGERRPNMIGVGIHNGHLLANQVQRFQFALMDRVNHFVIIKTLGGRHLYLPRRLESRANVRIVHGLIAGQIVGHRATVAGALHVIVSAQRIRTSSSPHVVSSDEQEIGDGCRCV